MSDPAPTPVPVPAPKKYPHLGLILILAAVLLAGGCVTYLLLPEGPGLEVPSEVKGAPGEFISVAAISHGSVTWYCPDPGLAVFPAAMLRDGKTAVVLAKAPGRYRLVAFAAHHGHLHGPGVCVVVVGNAPPPTPPGPGPVPPAPTDPIAKAITDAYAAETDPQKAPRVQLLAVFYDTAAKSTVSDPAIADTSALLKTLQAARKSLLPDDAILTVRKAIETQLNAVLAKPAPLDAAKRAEVSGLFTKIGAALGGLK